MIPSLNSDYSPSNFYSKLAQRFGDTNFKIIALATTFFATYFLFKVLFRKKTPTESRSYFPPAKIINIFSNRSSLPNTQKTFPLFRRRIVVGSKRHSPYTKITNIFSKGTFLSKKQKATPLLKNRVAVGSKQYSPYIKVKKAFSNKSSPKVQRTFLNQTQNSSQFNRVPVGSKQYT